MLLLKKLILNNWCNLIGEKTIEFEKGFNVINGKNGSGKTSIVNALSILLLNRYDGNWEGFINNKNIEASIILTFFIDNDIYESSLFLSKKGKSVTSERKLSKNSIDIASGEDCAIQLNKILPSFLTSYSLIYRQGGDDKVTDCSDADRRDLLSQLCSIDYTNKVNQFIIPNVDSLNERITQKEKEKFALENKTYSFGELKEIKEKHPQEKIDNLKSKVQLFEENERNKIQKSQLQIKINNLQNEYNSLKIEYDIDTLQKKRKEEIDKCNNLIQIIPGNYETEITEYKESTKEDLTSIIKAIADLNKRISNLQIKDTPEFDEKKLKDITADINSLSTKKDILEKNIESLKKGICPICGNNCTHKLEEVKKEFSDISNQLGVLYSTKNQLEIEEQEFENNKKENEKTEKLKNQYLLDIKDLESSVESKKAEIRNHITEIKGEMEAKLQSQKAKIISIDNLYDEKIESANAILLNKEEELKKVKNEFDSIEIKEVEDCRDELNKLEKENQEIDQIISYNNAIVAQNELTKKQQETDKILLDKTTKDLIDLKNSLADYKLSVEILTKTYPAWKLEKDIIDIENKTNIFIEDIYKPLYIKFIANKNSLKMIYGNGERDLPIKRLSGAEKQIVNLAVENVFNQQQGLACLILDECDSAMDKDNKETFFNTLLSLSDYYEQILVITHSDDIKNKLQVEGCNLILLGNN